MTGRNTTVLLNDVCFTYGGIVGNQLTLKNVTMGCCSSEISVIVGPSGCGKSTLVKLIIGAKKPLSGSVSVFGHKSIADLKKYAHIPGPSLGYMPQDDSIPTDLRVSECLYFFSVLHKMSPNETKNRVQTVLTQLDLYNVRRKYVWTLSGGMKRRLSLAVAIIHQPELLVVDEPTVGADPILRHKIWVIMNEIKSAGTTIIVTTHYMDECRQADIVCFVKKGELLTSDKPDRILQALGAIDLDDAFIKISQRSRRNELISISYQRSVQFNKPTLKVKNNFWLSLRVVLLLIYRYWHLFVFTPASTITILAIPTFNVYMANLAFSSSLKNVPIGLTIENQTNYQERELLIGLNATPICLDCLHPSHFSEFISPEKFSIHYYNSIDAAIEDVITHKIYVAVHFNERFAEALIEKLIRDGSSLDEAVFRGSTIRLFADTSSTQVFKFIDSSLTDSYEKYWKSCKRNLSLRDLSPYPIEYMESPIDGKEPDNDRPAHLILAFYFTACVSGCVIVSGLALVTEIQDNCMERYLSTGLTSWQVFCSQLFANSAYLSISACLGLTNAMLLIETPVKGALLSAFTVIFLSVLVSILLGQLIAVASVSKMVVLTSAVLIAFLLMCSQDTFVSAKSYPYFLAHFLEFLPYLPSINSVRSIAIYGHSIYHSSVFRGYLVNCVYIGFLLPLAYSLVKLRM